VVGVLAGGRSRRMGRDKATLEVDGETLLERTLRVAAEAGLEAVVAGRTGPVRPPHQAGPDDLSEVRYIPDEAPGLGPLGGILTLLRALERPILALPTDLAGLSSAALTWLAEEAERHMLADGLAVRDTERRLQPLFSVYTPLVLPLADRLLTDGQGAPRHVLTAGRFRMVDLPEVYAADLQGVDTPQDWERLRK